MGNVGLLLVGVVLFVNGLVSIGIVKPRSAAPLNLFVGAAQVVLPTLILVQAGGDAGVVNGTWPSLLFGFTYLWFGLIQIYDLEPQGFGWYSAFVAAIALFHAVKSIGTDPVFAVIWATWAVMWTLFFVLLGLGISRVGSFDLGHFTGWVLILLGIPTCTLPAIFLLNGAWSVSPVAGVAALAALGAGVALSTVLARRTARADKPASVSAPVPVEVVPARQGAHRAATGVTATEKSRRLRETGAAGRVVR